MKAKPAMHRVRQEPDENQIRDYARHLYEQSGCLPGRDLDNWLEAERTLKAALQQGAPSRGRHDRAPSEGFAKPVEEHHLVK